MEPPPASTGSSPKRHHPIYDGFHQGSGGAINHDPLTLCRCLLTFEHQRSQPLCRAHGVCNEGAPAIARYTFEGRTETGSAEAMIGTRFQLAPRHNLSHRVSHLRANTILSATFLAAFTSQRCVPSRRPLFNDSSKREARPGTSPSRTAQLPDCGRHRCFHVRSCSGCSVS